MPPARDPSQPDYHPLPITRDVDCVRDDPDTRSAQQVGQRRQAGVGQTPGVASLVRPTGELGGPHIAVGVASSALLSMNGVPLSTRWHESTCLRG